MNFSEFAKRLYPIIGTGNSQQSFAKTLFETIATEEGQEILKTISLNTYKAYFNGHTGISKVAKKITGFLDKYEFEQYIEEQFSDLAKTELCEMFSDIFPTANEANIHERLADLFVEIIREAANSTNRSIISDAEPIIAKRKDSVVCDAPYPHGDEQRRKYAESFPVLRLSPNFSGDFVGREYELNYINDLLCHGKSVILLWGMGGIGKSTIAMEFARKGRFDYLQTVLFSECVSYNDLLNKIMYSKEIRDQITADPDSKEAIQQGAIGQLGSNQLIIIDNANQANETLINNLLANTKFRTIITTKNNIEIEHPLFAKIEVRELSLNEAYALFNNNYKRGDADICVFNEVVYREYSGNTEAILMVAKMLNVQGISLNEYVARKEELSKTARFEFSHNGETAYGSISSNLCFFLKVTEALEDLEETAIELLKICIIFSNVGLKESILIKSQNLPNANLFVELARRGLIGRQLLDNGVYYIRMHPLAAKTLTDVGIDPNDKQTYERAKEYVSTYIKIESDSADLSTLKELLEKFRPQASTEQTKNIETDNPLSIVKPDETVKVDLLDVLLDENNTAPIYMFDDKGNQLCFDQVAVIPYGEDDLYCILKPETHIDGVAEDEAIVFLVTEDDKGEAILKVCDNEDMAKAVFREYYRLILDTL